VFEVPCNTGWKNNEKKKNNKPKIPVLWYGQAINQAINGLKYQ
jgi:hypothetical protein